NEPNSMVLTNIGNVYYHLSDFEKALQYHQQAVKTDELTGNNENLAHDYDNLGNTYDEMNNQGKALEFYKKALQFYVAENDQRNMAANLINCAAIYTKQKQYDTALSHLQKALLIGESFTDEYQMSTILDGMAKIFLQAPAAFLLKNGIPASQRYLNVNKYLDRSLVLAAKTGSLDKQATTLELMSRVYEQQGSFSKALYTYRESVALNDSALNDETKQKATRQEMQYEFDKKEALTKAENDQKELLAAAEIKQQQTVKNAAIAGGIVLAIAAISIFAFYKRKRDAEQQQKDAEFKMEVADTEMKALRSQMNPHFIFNSLNSISDYISKNDISSADYYLTKFAKVMRMILENSDKKEVSLTEDLKALELYIQLESLRMKNKFSYEIIVDADIDPDNTMIPPLILQPFVENSIWHGISKKEGFGKILIHIKKEGELLNCIVEDNGIGREQSALPERMNTEKKSLGMKITKARIDIMNKIKKSKAAIELSDLAEGMRVEVKLPLELYF
ncbi:MAG: tetratricopeptide repeat protein, partial [Panacibacter sp.]